MGGDTLKKDKELDYWLATSDFHLCKHWPCDVDECFSLSQNHCDRVSLVLLVVTQITGGQAPSERLPIINHIMQCWLLLAIGILYCLKSCSLVKIWMNSSIFLALVAQLTNHLQHYPPSPSPSHFPHYRLDWQKQKKQVRRNFQISLFLSTHSGSQLKRQATEWQQAGAQGLYKLQIVCFITALNIYLAK